MARGRFISESVAKDMRLNSLSVEAELVYLMTIPHLDRDGLIEADTEVLYGTVCPKRRIFIDRMGEFVQEWVQVGLVTRYDTEQGSVLWFRGFAKNQVGLRYDRETPSIFPPPPGHTRDKTGLVPVPETPNLSTVDSIRQESGNVPEASDNCSAQWQDQVEDQDQEKDQSSPIPPTPLMPPPKADDGELGSVFSCWQDNMPGTITPILKEDIIDLVDECGARSVIHAITVSVEQNKRFFKYAASVARNHSAGRDAPGHRPPPKLTDEEKSKLITRAKTAQGKIRTTEQFKGAIDPTWLQDIEVAKGYGLL